ncbi:MAG: 3'-5' exonuclease [Candidatus Omnitrophica bacterium]|nr:3'-5' exonuclease [Candidatus Omnitrophota bacterium]
MNLTKNINEYDLVFLDVETTGLSAAAGEAICEIGAVKVRNHEVVDKFQCLVNPGQEIPYHVYKIHKISNEDVKDAPFFKDIAENLLEFLEGGVICAYNAPFDAGFINSELGRMMYAPWSGPVIDVLTMARCLIKSQKYNLETVVKFFNIECPQNFHRALEDALVTAKVFAKLLEISKEKSLEEILSRYGSSKKS